MGIPGTLTDPHVALVQWGLAHGGAIAAVMNYTVHIIPSVYQHQESSFLQSVAENLYSLGAGIAWTRLLFPCRISRHSVLSISSIACCDFSD